MYNKAKYLSGKVGSILAVALGGVILAAAIALIVCFEIIYFVSSPVIFAFYIGMFCCVILGVVFLSLGRGTMGKPELIVDKSANSEQWAYSPIGKDITLTIMSGCMFIAGIVVMLLFSMVLEFDFLFFLIGICVAVVSAGIVGAKVVSMLIKGNPVKEEIVSEEVATEEVVVSEEENN